MTDEQELAVRRVKKNDMGILMAPPGAGKTVMACALIGSRKVSTLILLHRGFMLDQWKERILQFLNIDPKDIGTLGGSKKKTTGKLDLVMLQTLTRMEDISEIAQNYSQIIIDDGNNEVFLGESKLKRFIDSVEKVTGSIPESMPHENAQSKQLELDISDVNAEEKMPDNPWNDLISAGASILQNLSKVVAASDKNSNPFIVQDQNGTRYLKFPVPDKDRLRAITNVLLQFTQVVKNAKEDANIPEPK